MLSSEFRVNSLHVETSEAEVAFGFIRLYNEDRAAMSIAQNDAEGFFFFYSHCHTSNDGEVMI